MKTYGSALMLAVMLIMSPAVGYGQEQSPNKPPQIQELRSRKTLLQYWGESRMSFKLKKKNIKKTFRTKFKIKSNPLKINSMP